MVDGFALPETPIDGLAEGRPTTLEGNLVLGWSWTNPAWAKTNVQVFGRKLTLEEMRSLTVGGGCGGGLEGDYLAWRDMQWNVTTNSGQLTWRGVTRADLCSRSRPVRFVNTGWSTHRQAVGFCSRIQNSHIPGTYNLA